MPDWINETQNPLSPGRFSSLVPAATRRRLARLGDAALRLVVSKAGTSSVGVPRGTQRHRAPRFSHQQCRETIKERVMKWMPF